MQFATRADFDPGENGARISSRRSAVTRDCRIVLHRACLPGHTGSGLGVCAVRSNAEGGRIPLWNEAGHRGASLVSTGAVGAKEMDTCSARRCMPGSCGRGVSPFAILLGAGAIAMGLLVERREGARLSVWVPFTSGGAEASAAGPGSIALVFLKSSAVVFGFRARAAGFSEGGWSTGSTGSAINCSMP